MRKYKSSTKVNHQTVFKKPVTEVVREQLVDELLSILRADLMTGKVGRFTQTSGSLSMDLELSLDLEVL